MKQNEFDFRNQRIKIVQKKVLPLNHKFCVDQCYHYKLDLLEIELLTTNYKKKANERDSCG